MAIFPDNVNPAECLTAERLIDGCDWAYWTEQHKGPTLPKEWKDGALVYCQTDHVFELFRKLRLHPCRVILVSNESDHSVSPNHFAARPWNVVEWFGANATAEADRCHVLPRALANHYCALTLKPESFAGAIPDATERDRWLYVNHRVETNPAVRQPAWNYFASKVAEGWITLESPAAKGETTDYARALREHRFICCPPGNGLDTHRMWEALYSKAIPVVLRSRVTEAFAELPIVLVNDYSEVTLQFLQSEFAKLQHRTFNFELLALSHWLKRLNAASIRAKSTPRHVLVKEWLGRKLTLA